MSFIKELIYCDIDGCLADFKGMFKRKTKDYYGIDIDLAQWKVHHNGPPDLTQDQKNELFRELFVLNSCSFLSINCIPDIQFYRQVHSWTKAGAGNIELYTGRRRGLQGLTLKWLNQNSIPYDDITFTPGVYMHGQEQSKEIKVKWACEKDFTWIIDDDFTILSQIARLKAVKNGEDQPLKGLILFDAYNSYQPIGISDFNLDLLEEDLEFDINTPTIFLRTSWFEVFRLIQWPKQREKSSGRERI